MDLPVLDVAYSGLAHRVAFCLWLRSRCSDFQGCSSYRLSRAFIPFCGWVGSHVWIHNWSAHQWWVCRQFPLSGCDGHPGPESQWGLCGRGWHDGLICISFMLMPLNSVLAGHLHAFFGDMLMQVLCPFLTGLYFYYWVERFFNTFWILDSYQIFDL